MFAFVVLFFSFALDTGWNRPMKLIDGAVSRVVLGRNVGVLSWLISAVPARSRYFARFFGSLISSILPLAAYLMKSFALLEATESSYSGSRFWIKS